MASAVNDSVAPGYIATSDRRFGKPATGSAKKSGLD
jgi:hypothetical protein